ncbi:MAG: hypothetical protein HC822_01530 [Oscillochloris sp.]|nr:hypothetical protein [Oscillochloris sp.]
MLLRLRILFIPLFIAALLVLVSIAGRSDAGPTVDTATGRPEQVALTTIPTEGASLLASLGASYLSPVQATATPFTHILLRWEALVPAGAHVHIEVRASFDGMDWTPWGEVLENPDLWVPADGDYVFWSQEIYAGEGVQFWQVRAQTSRLLMECCRASIRSKSILSMPASARPTPCRPPICNIPLPASTSRR